MTYRRKDVNRMWPDREDTCSICGGPNEPWPHDHDDWPSGYGHNAQPVNDGRCCSTCNAIKVIPARFALAGWIKDR